MSLPEGISFGKSLSNQGQCPQDSSKEWMTRHVAGMPHGCLRAEANGPMKMASFGTERIHDTIFLGGCKNDTTSTLCIPMVIYIYGIHWDFNGILWWLNGI